MIAQFLIAIGATEPTSPPEHAGWPLLAVASVVGLILLAIALRRQEGED